ncbi:MULTISPECIES: hypothetical protein [Shewanella]|uniref:hypothetical protein n=2 Tax=Shewanellaceae TaxID=267890 RepID=UPI000D370FB1|nr:MULTISPECIES: hypothetical protein [Shewanella]MCI2963366.1 hypothetical protein [Shewanella sp. N2AIL]
MIKTSLILFFLHVFSFSVLANEALKFEVNGNNFYITIYNNSEKKVELNYILCFEPLGGISFDIKDENGVIYGINGMFDSGCALNEKISVPRYGIIGQIVDKDLVKMIYDPVPKKLHVTAMFCENYFTREKCLTSNTQIVDFSVK